MLGAGERFSVRAGEQPRLLSVVSGSVRSGGENAAAPKGLIEPLLPPGENVLLPFAGAFTFVAASTAIMLVTENFV